jgi:hypothetical protein
MTENSEKPDVKTQPKPDEKTPPAGPHAKPELTDRDKTPGSGALPDKHQPDADGGTG